jgi:dTDP-4-amino-4,6-dideoxygalactose transaminase
MDHTATPSQSRSIPFLDLGAMHAPLWRELDEAVGAVTRSSAFVGGDRVAAFEDAWARYCGSDHAVGVANGTDALALALRALGIGTGDEILLPTNTFVATAEAVLAAGADPVFVDVDPETLLIDLVEVEASIGPRTAAVIPVHLFGQPVDMDAVERMARRHGLAVVEDAAQAHGATWRGRPVGSFGDAGCFSFYPGKNLGAFGDGGAVVTGDGAVADRIRSLADHGRSAESKHRHEHVGTNSRLDGLQAAVLRVKLDHLDRWTAQRRRAHDDYEASLRELPVAQVSLADHAASAHHLEVVRVARRDDVARSLAEGGVTTGVHYPVPCHLQPALSDWYRRPLPVAEKAAEEILSLPMFPTITRGQVDQVCERFDDALARGFVLEGSEPGGSDR